MLEPGSRLGPAHHLEPERLKSGASRRLRWTTQTELPEFSEIIVEERDNFSFLDDDIFQDQAKWDSDVTYQQQIAVLQNSFIQDDHLPTVQCPVHIPVREGQSSEQFSLPLEDSEIILSGKCERVNLNDSYLDP